MSTRYTDLDGELIESPCIGVCKIDRAQDLCSGCGRSVSEIADWSGMTSEHRRAVMQELPDRLSKGRTRQGGARSRRRTA